MALNRPPPLNQDIFTDIPPGSDYFFIYLHDDDGKKRFIVQSLDNEGVTGLWFDDPNQPGEQRKLTNAELASMDVSFLHIYGKARFSYTTAWSFFRALGTFYPVREVYRDRIEQRRFNRMELVRADRMRLLEHFLRKTVEKPDYHSSVVALMAGLYTLRLMDHPRYDETEQYYELLLNSLVQSGELQRNGASYSMTDRTIPTLEHLQGQKERHDDNIKQQHRIGWLTAVLICVAIIQAVITIWTELHADPAPPALINSTSITDLHYWL
jgi:hypothetical protein